MPKARLLLALFVSTFTPITHAEPVSVGDAYDAFNQFMVTVRVFDAFEKRDGTYQSASGVNTSAGGLAALIMSEAWAVPGKDGTKCLLAGYYGVVKSSRCVPDSDTKMFDAKGNVVCSPNSFGPGIVIPRPKDSRWTMACANEVIRKAGFTAKSAEDKFSHDEVVKLGKFLREKQGLSFANTLSNSILIECETLAPKSQDFKDCDRVTNVVQDALIGYAPAAPEGASTGGNKASTKKSIDKSFEDCWKEWTKKDAKFKAKTEVSLKGKFDSLIDLTTLAGCRLNSIDESSWKNDGINPDDCKISVGSEVTFESFTPTDKDLHEYFVLNGTADCVKADKSVVKKTGKLKIDCSTAGTEVSRVVYRSLRLFERHFDLSPACVYVLKKDGRGKDIIGTDETGKKAQ